MLKFKIIRCKHCGRCSVTSKEKVFKCIYCRKSESFFKKKILGLAVNLLKSFESGHEASIYCKVANASLVGGKELADKLYTQ
jgi:hypothetical protein